MYQKKYLFIDRDGTLIAEPDDYQVDRIDKLRFLPGVFNALTQLKRAGYQLVMVTNQDGLGTLSFPEADFLAPHDLMLSVFQSQHIEFDAIHICPHWPTDQCDCRKPKLGLVMDYIRSQHIDLQHSYVIGDRQTDVLLADAMGIQGLQIGSPELPDWSAIVDRLLRKPRTACVVRNTNETKISIMVSLDSPGRIDIKTGLGFFDHMLEQLVKHAGMSATIQVSGDLHIDDHHTIEDTALALGAAIKDALGDKWGIARYGFLLPMDESEAQVSLDLSGRAYCQWSADFHRDKVGDLATEMVSHFFKSFSDALHASLHIRATGENTHHMIEVIFKGVGRVLRQAFVRESDECPSTKGIL